MLKGFTIYYSMLLCYNTIQFYSTTTSVPRVTTTSKNLSYGWHENYAVKLNWNLLRCPHFNHQKFKSILLYKNNLKRIYRKHKIVNYLMMMEMTYKHCNMIIDILNRNYY